MGYTHYWNRRRNLTKAQWQEYTDAVKIIVVAAGVEGVPLWHEYDEPGSSPEISGDQVFFNGAGEDGHETFVIERKVPEPAWQGATRGAAFCKTERKPYDKYVVACLLALEGVAPGVFKLASDGSQDEWREGLSLVRAIKPDWADLEIPATIY